MRTPVHYGPVSLIQSHIPFTDYSNKGLLNALIPVLFMVSTANSSRGDLREETHRKPLPKTAKNRVELEFGQVMASQNHGASTSLINYRTVRKMVYAAPRPRKIVENSTLYFQLVA